MGTTSRKPPYRPGDTIRAMYFSPGTGTTLGPVEVTDVEPCGADGWSVKVTHPDTGHSRSYIVNDQGTSDYVTGLEIPSPPPLAPAAVTAEVGGARDRAFLAADKVATELADRTGLHIEPIYTGAGGTFGIEAAMVDPRDAAADGDPYPYVHITAPNQPELIPCDDHGNFPAGLAVIAYDEHGNQDGGNDQAPLLEVYPEERRDRPEILDLLVGELAQWKTRQEQRAAATDVPEQASSVALGADLALAWEDTPDGDVTVYATDLDGNDMRALALVRDAESLPAVLAIAADTARTLFPEHVHTRRAR